VLHSGFLASLEASPVHPLGRFTVRAGAVPGAERRVPAGEGGQRGGQGASAHSGPEPQRDGDIVLGAGRAHPLQRQQPLLAGREWLAEWTFDLRLLDPRALPGGGR
jgi:hypothetical protein